MFNIGDFNNLGNVFLIRLMTTYSKCTYTDFLLAVNNRFSSWSFLGGAVTKLAVQLYQYPTSATYVAFFKIKDNFSAGDWKNVGLGVQLFFSKLVNFQAPRVKTNPSTF